MKIQTFFYCLSIFIFSITIAIVFYLSFHFYSKKVTREEKIIIPKTCSIRCVASILEKNNIIQNENLFVVYASVFSFFGKKIIAGEYLVEKNSNISQIFDKITSGKVIIHKVTIPEGLTTYQVIELLKKQYGVINDIEDKDNVFDREGGLFPSTYEYLYGTNLSDLLTKMQDEMQKILEAEWKNRDTSGTKELKVSLEALILASIIEKEAKFEGEKALIAGVYLNRLRKNMPLQADPTVIYGLSKWNNFDRKVTHNDLKAPSPYNTYIHPGLPPTPICNPGKSSIVGALHPQRTDALYFVAEGTGRHLFSNNYKQHLKNIGKIKSHCKNHSNCR